MTVLTEAFAGTFVADAAHSSFQFDVTHMGVGTFRATFEDVTATVVAGEAGVRLEGAVAVASLSIHHPPEFRHHVLNGADFFDASNHPEVAFRSETVELADDGTFRGRGELTIKGITKPIEASGRYRPLVEDPYGAERTAIELHATVDRRDWGMDWQAPLPQGGDALGYEVRLSAHIELIRQA